MFNYEQIKKALPHRYPFLLVDKVESLSENEITAIKNVTGNEPFFLGHFPQMAVMPGVLQVEAMAQTAGLILALNQRFDADNQLAFLASVGNARFKKPVVPGDTLSIYAKIKAQKSSLLKVESSISVDKVIVSQAELSMVIK